MNAGSSSRAAARRRRETTSVPTDADYLERGDLMLRCAASRMQGGSLDDDILIAITNEPDVLLLDDDTEFTFTTPDNRIVELGAVADAIDPEMGETIIERGIKQKRADEQIIADLETFIESFIESE